jgi:hypothetical protein
MERKLSTYNSDGFTGGCDRMLGYIAEVRITYLSECISDLLIRNYPRVFLDTCPVENRWDNPLAPYTILEPLFLQLVI